METSKAGVDLQKGENPIASKVAELLLDLLVLAATTPSSSLLRLFLCAVGVAAATVRDGGGGGPNPVDSICVNTGHSTRDPVPGRSSILRQEGPLASYRGCALPLDGSIPARALFMGVLEATRSAVSPAALSLGATEPSTSASAGAVGGLAAAVAAQVVWTPVDVISQRLMTQGNSSPASRYRGGLDAFRSTASGEGDCGGGLLHSIRIWITAAGSHPVRCSCCSLVVGPEFCGVGPASGGVTCTGLRCAVDAAKLEIFSWKLHASWWAPLAWGPTFQRVLHAVLCVVLSDSLVKTRGLQAQLLMVMGATGLSMELHPPFLFIFFYISAFYYVMLRACTFTVIPSDKKLACISIMQPQILPIQAQLDSSSSGDGSTTSPPPRFPTSSFIFYLRRREKSYPSVARNVLRQRLRRPTFNRRFARSFHPGVCAIDASTAPRRRARRRHHLLCSCCSYPVTGPCSIPVFSRGPLCNMAA